MKMLRFSKQTSAYLLVSFCMCSGKFWSLENGSISNNLILNKEGTIEIQHPKIIIGIVSCRKENDETSSIESSVLIKSVLISAMVYYIKEIDFHMFLEHKNDSLYFENFLKVKY